MNDKQVAVTDRRHIAADTAPVVQNEGNAVVLSAMNHGYTPEQVEKMLDLQMKFEANEARKAHFDAVAAFKEEAPPVKKDKHNKFFDSWYTSLGVLLGTYNPYLGKHGLSVSFAPPVQTDKSMTVECRLAHRMGHVESISMTGPIDTAAVGKQSGQRSRNALQDVKSTFTYLRSATCEGILGVAGTEGTLDDDGNAGGNVETDFITPEQAAEITELIKAKNVDAEKWLEFKHLETVDTMPANRFKAELGELKKAAVRKSREPGAEG